MLTFQRPDISEQEATTVPLGVRHSSFLSLVQVPGQTRWGQAAGQQSRLAPPPAGGQDLVSQGHTLVNCSGPCLCLTVPREQPWDSPHGTGELQVLAGISLMRVACTQQSSQKADTPAHAARGGLAPARHPRPRECQTMPRSPVASPHWPSVLLANLLKGTSTEKMRPENMTWTPSSGMVAYILMPMRETTMPFFRKPGPTTLLLKMIWTQGAVDGKSEGRRAGGQPLLRLLPGKLRPPPPPRHTGRAPTSFVITPWTGLRVSTTRSWWYSRMMDLGQESPSSAPQK